LHGDAHGLEQAMPELDDRWMQRAPFTLIALNLGVGALVIKDTAPSANSTSEASG
jgi:hypothetical protein